jgi:hypothetical protein
MRQIIIFHFLHHLPDHILRIIFVFMREIRGSSRIIPLSSCFFHVSRQQIVAARPRRAHLTAFPGKRYNEISDH